MAGVIRLMGGRHLHIRMEANSTFYAQPKPNITAGQDGKKSRVSIGVMVLEKCNSRWKPYYQVTFLLYAVAGVPAR